MTFNFNLTLLAKLGQVMNLKLKINNKNVCVYSQDFTVMGGSLSNTAADIAVFNCYLVDEGYFDTISAGSSSGSIEDSSEIDSNLVSTLGLEMDTIYYNLDASQTGWGYHYLDTLTIENDGYIFTRRTTSSIVGANQAVFYLNYGYDLEEQMYLVGYENQTEIIPI